MKQIADDLKQAMRDKDAAKTAVLRMLVAEIKNAEIEKKGELNEEETVKVLSKQAKKREEAIEIYEKAGRQELADKEKAELQVIKSYLPAQMSEAEVREAVKQMEELKTVKGDFGAGMKLVMAKLKGKADGGLIAKVVREEL